MKAYILENGDITITNGAWIILRWRKDKNRITRIADCAYGRGEYWKKAVALLEKTKLGK